MRNFESPDSLNNQEIKELKKESRLDKPSIEMQNRLTDELKQKLFLQEYISYLNRSKNQQSIKWIDRMFRKILTYIGMDAGSLEEGLSQAKKKITGIEKTQEEF